MKAHTKIAIFGACMPCWYRIFSINDTTHKIPEITPEMMEKFIVKIPTVEKSDYDFKGQTRGRNENLPWYHRFAK